MTSKKFTLHPVVERNAANEEEKMDQHFIEKTELAIQKMSARYAHEVLNALTPALGVMQILKSNADKKLTDRDLELVQLAQDELIKGKNFITDFMMLNLGLEYKPRYISLYELREYVEEKISWQVPEIMPYLNFRISGKENEEVFIDVDQLRLAIYFIVNSWVDYVTSPSVLVIEFSCPTDEELHVNMNMTEEKVSLKDTNEEFRMLLHLVKKHVRRSHGEMEIGDGITLIYSSNK